MLTAKNDFIRSNQGVKSTLTVSELQKSTFTTGVSNNNLLWVAYFQTH